MNNLLKKNLNLGKIEFWAAATIYTFAVILLLTKVADSNYKEIWTPYRYMFNNYHLHYSYSKFYFFPQIFRYTGYCGAFLLWNFVIVPALAEKKRIAWNIILAAALLVALWGLFGITDTWLKGYLFYHKSADYVYNLVFKTNVLYALWVMMMLTFYSMIKYSANFLLSNVDKIQAKYRVLTHDCIIAIVIFMIIAFMMALADFPVDLITTFVIIAPVAIGVYALSFYSLIPQTLAKNSGIFRYLLKVAGVMLLISIPIGILTSLIFEQSEPTFIIGGFNCGIQLLITAPFAWIVYKRKMSGNQEITYLKTALGRSTADLDFLRSQINPHFLFNALNTLYGTALQENSERTAEGIQRLGDMMRFMLQENMQEKILLVREIDYLNNYIALQKLRTQTSPDISIVLQIEDHVNALQIAPMLLIPFIENAFKHGISLREPSHINISLQTKESTLYFDVHNSIHPKIANDTEKYNNGVGLENVKQRLVLLYPNKHELVIRESAKDFFIHLTIQLQ
ncbi:histidine kinase [Mucilaginibacter sp. cycad4]|uniref:sensor histidine kinase n=1 Tax=Mucilaginibacter sp. cycad4 TaxID=3342096 RepID=UPI002AAB4ACF|nr:histidine kinase [Mucilaginibacter gossypii]WPU98158.1 histidine kinase [Mucilaginibacter gossypii]